MRPLLPFRLALGGLLPLAGCAVYVPTTPSTPLVEQGQAELWAGLRSFTTLEAGGAWSPRPHLLLALETAWQEADGSLTKGNQTITYHDYNRQVSAGLGYYRSSALRQPRWYWAAVAGAGFATASQHAVAYNPFDITYSGDYYGHYQARYWRAYGQAYGAWSATSHILLGTSLRATFVGYQQLVLDGQPVSPAARGFAEPTFFARFGQGVIQAQATLGLSTPLGRHPNDPRSQFTAPVSSLLGASVILRPDLLFHRRAAL